MLVINILFEYLIKLSLFQLFISLILQINWLLSPYRCFTYTIRMLMLAFISDMKLTSFLLKLLVPNCASIPILRSERRLQLLLQLLISNQLLLQIIHRGAVLIVSANIGSWWDRTQVLLFRMISRISNEHLGLIDNLLTYFNVSVSCLWTEML